MQHLMVSLLFLAQLYGRVSFVYYFIWCLMSAMNKIEFTASMDFSLFNIFIEFIERFEFVDVINVMDVDGVSLTDFLFIYSILNRKILKFAFLFMSMFNFRCSLFSFVGLNIKILCFVLNRFQLLFHLIDNRI